VALDLPPGIAVELDSAAAVAISRKWKLRGSNAFALVSAAVCLYSMRRADPDLWGHLSYGRLFVERGGLPSDDPFAYTSTGLQWIHSEYIAQITLWLAYHYGGPLGLIALKCVVGGAALYFLFVALRTTTDEPYLWLPLFLLCASPVSRFFLFRPQLFTYAFFSLFVAVLVRFLLRRRAHLWMLPIVMLVWANAHGGFVAGLGAIGLAILLRASENVPTGPLRPRRILEGTAALWMALVACVGATLINPIGWRLWAYLFSELTNRTNREYIVEWGPPSMQVDPWAALALTVITATLALMAWFGRDRSVSGVGARPAYWVLSCLPLLVMAWVSMRHLPLAAIWIGPVVALLGASSNVRDRTGFGPIWFALTGVALLPIGLTYSIVYDEPRPLVSVDGLVFGGTHPCGAVRFLRENHLAGNVYNPLWWGSYLTWELYPAIRVSMDGRNVTLFPEEMVRENLEFYDARRERLDSPLQYDTDFLLIPSNQPALRPISSDKRWRQVYRDNDSALFTRAERADAQHSWLPSSLGAVSSPACSDLD
jgi:hypothetical protein